LRIALRRRVFRRVKVQFSHGLQERGRHAPNDSKLDERDGFL